MNLEIFLISKDKFAELIGDMDGKSAAIAAAGLSAEIIVGMIGDKPIGFVGIAPRTLMSTEAYIWMIANGEHPYLFNKYGRKFVETITEKYTLLFGHCFNRRSAIWLKYLGAEFISETEFEFRRV
jgi:hypothetical protein